MFRKEAISAKKHGLQGRVFFPQPVALHLFGYLLTTIFAIIVALLVMGSYARSEMVRGHVVPESGVIKIRSSLSGTLASLAVVQGERVNKGQVLALVQSHLANSKGESANTKMLQSLLAQEMEVGRQVELEKRQFEHESRQVEREIKDLGMELEALEAHAVHEQRLLASLEENYKKKLSLNKQGFISDTKLQEEEQGWLRELARKSLSDKQRILSKSKLGSLQSHRRKLAIRSAERLAQLREKKSRLESHRAELDSRSATSILSPVDGEIIAIKHPGKGHSVTAAEVLMSISPQQNELVAELFVPSRAVGFVNLGQEVRLQYDAFPYRLYGSYPARINRISAGIFQPGELPLAPGIGEPVYVVRARLSSQHVNAHSKYIKLQTGMTLTGNIILERRSFMQWLMSPLYSIGRRS